MQHNNAPLTRLTPLSAEKWQEACGSGAGNFFYQGSYGVELRKDGRWEANYNETTRIPDRDALHATKEEAMEACRKDREWCILRATAKKKAA